MTETEWAAIEAAAEGLPTWQWEADIIGYGDDHAITCGPDMTLELVGNQSAAVAILTVAAAAPDMVRYIQRLRARLTAAGVAP